MPYRLRDNVTYCRVDGHLVFLDLEQDRYFRLSDRMESVLLACLHGDTQPGPDISDLVQRNVLTQNSGGENRTQFRVSQPPLRSAIEQKIDAPQIDVPVMLEVLAIVYSMQLQLKTRRLMHLIDALVGYRRRKVANNSSGQDEATLLQAASLFRRARLYVPIETCCLLDSLSMLRFLARRRLSSSLVFGVTQDPFAAHCWVQAGGWVLNDTIGNAIAHTPIRKV